MPISNDLLIQPMREQLEDDERLLLITFVERARTSIKYDPEMQCHVRELDKIIRKLSGKP